MGRKRKPKIPEAPVIHADGDGSNNQVTNLAVAVPEPVPDLQSVAVMDGPPPLMPQFPNQNTMEEIYRAKVFGGPPVPIPIENANEVTELRRGAHVESALIIGGGWSALPFYDKLKTKKNTFGCSGVPLVCPVTFWYSCDVLKTDEMKKWLEEDKKTTRVFCVEAWKGQKIPSNGYWCKTSTGPVTNMWGLWHGCSSAIGALELARYLGAKRSFIFGVDYVENDHPFDVRDPGQAKDRKPWNEERVMAHWKYVATNYKQMNLELFCCNKNSLLVSTRILPYCDPNMALGTVP